MYCRATYSHRLPIDEINVIATRKSNVMNISVMVKYFAVVKSRDIPICNLLAKCQEIISLVIVRKSGKSVTSYLLMNINELVLLP